MDPELNPDPKLDPSEPDHSESDPSESDPDPESGPYSDFGWIRIGTV